MKLWKRNAIMAAIVLFVCGAVYLNWSYNQRAETGKTLGEAALVGAESDKLVEGKDGKEGQQDAAQQEGADKATGSEYFASARLNRQQARDSALSILQDAASEEGAATETIAQANQAIQTMADQTVTEAQIENLVTAKGYSDCVAFLGDNSISVVVSTLEDGLTDTDVARIGEIVMEQTGFSADQVKIIEAD